MAPTAPHRALQVGRYRLGREIAAGGLGVVHLACAVGEGGFGRAVAIKRLHPHLARDTALSTAFLDEARLAACVRHPNVVATLDVVSVDGELFVVMEYVHGVSLAQLLRAAVSRGARAPVPVILAIMAGVLRGLHCAHEAKDERGTPLGLVHRDVSPQNILVGADGVARIADFGVAKARGRALSTQDGSIKGKLAYMAPEQLCGEPVSARTDVFAAGIVLWEALTVRRLFGEENEGAVVMSIMTSPLSPPSTLAPEVDPALDAMVMRALEREPSARFASALEMAEALEAAAPMASAPRVAAWVEELVGEKLARRARSVAEIEAISRVAQESPISSIQGLDASPRTLGGAAPNARAGGLRLHRAALAAAASGALATAAAATVLVGPAKHDVAPAVRATSAPAPERSAPSPTVLASNQVDASAGETPPTTSPALGMKPFGKASPPTSTSKPAPVVRAAKPAGTRRSASPAKSCSPPFFVDAQGRRIFKEECL